MAMSQTEHKPTSPEYRLAGTRAAAPRPAPTFTAVHALVRPPVARAGLKAHTGV